MKKSDALIMLMSDGFIIKDQLGLLTKHIFYHCIYRELIINWRLYRYVEDYFNIIKDLNDEYKRITKKGVYSDKETDKLIPYDVMKEKIENDIMLIINKFKTLKSLKTILFI